MPKTENVCIPPGARPADDPTVLALSGTVRPAKKSALDGQFATPGTDTAAYAAYATTEALTDDSLSALTGMAQELVACERDLAAAMAKVVQATKNLEDVQEKRLPDLMEKFSLDSLEFTDKDTGLKRTIELIKDKWRVSLPPKSGKNADPQWEMKRDCVFASLIDDGQRAIIKHDLSMPLGLMSDDDVMKIAAKIKEDNPSAEVSLSKYVEPASLTAYVNRKLKAGENVNEYIVTKPVREAKVKGTK